MAARRINPRVGKLPPTSDMGLGQLVFIGPASRRTGKPVKQGQIPDTHLFVAWCANGGASRLLKRLQQGNPQRLVNYGAMPTTLDGAKNLCARWAQDRVRGHWYQVSPRLAIALRYVRGELAGTEALLGE
jgi:hypothetical protein